MCGIAGCVSLRDDERVEPAVVEAMADALRHRGPDGSGRFAWPAAAAPRVAFAMRRLAILDLDTGDQPVRSEDGGVTAVMNGEIYNYVELRAELEQRGHRFRSTGDTEVLAHLYEERGLDLFAALRGMYAFALWDAARERALIAVDHAGIKPLYVHRTAARLTFASEVKGLCVDPRVPKRLRSGAVETYCTFGYTVGEETTFAGVDRLAPGTALVVERGAVRQLRHWAWGDGGQVLNRASAAPGGRMHDSRPDPHRLGQDLDEAVRLHLRSDVPVGLFLSGGLDSAGLLGLMHRHVGTVRTFTVGYESGGRAVRDETRPAAAAAARAAAAHRELRLSAREWWTALEQAVVAEDEPIANPSMVSLHALAAAASRDVRVVLNGTGGDELFGGYPAHRDLPRCLDRHAARRGRAPSWPGRVVPRAIGAVEAAYPFLRRWPGLARFPKHLSRARSAWLTADEACRRLASFEWLTLTDAQRRRLYGPDLTRAWHDGDTARAYRAVFDDSRAASDDTRGQAQALVMRTWLPGNGLLSLDKVTMAHGLEARVPYLDRVFMERVMRLDAATRLQRGKALLAGALHGVLPAELLVRPKQPFETPIALWFDRDLADDVRAVILDPGARIRALFRMDAVERVLRRQAARRVEQVELIFRLLVLELWWRRVLQA